MIQPERNLCVTGLMKASRHIDDGLNFIVWYYSD